MGRALRVWMIPDYTEGNPYQRLLVRALREEGVEVVLRSPAHPREMLEWGAGMDVLHVHWFPFWFSPSWTGFVRRVQTFFRAVRRLRERGVRVVYTVHNLRDHENALRGWRWRAVENWALRRWVREVDGWVFHCGEARVQIPGSQGKPALVFPHMDPAPAYPPLPSRGEARRILGIPEDRRVLLVMGQIRPYKALDRWVEALQRVPELELLVVGACKLPGGCEHLCRERVRLVEGFVPDARLPLFAAAGDGVLVPQPTMLTSGVAALAMAWGRPVLVPRTGCNPEVVPPEAGWFFQPDEPSRWWEVLASFARATSEELRARGEVGRRWMDRWKVQTMARALAALYREVRA